MKLLIVEENTNMDEIIGVDAILIRNDYDNVCEFVKLANQNNVQVYFWIVEYKSKNVDLNEVNCIFINKEIAVLIENGMKDEQILMEDILKRYKNLRIVLLSGSKGYYYKDKDFFVYQKSLGKNIDEKDFIKKFLEYEMKGYTEMTSLYKACV